MVLVSTTKGLSLMKYVVRYVNPNNVIRTEPITQEFTRKADFSAFMRNARYYSGSYNILDAYKENSKGQRLSV